MKSSFFTLFILIVFKSFINPSLESDNVGTEGSYIIEVAFADFFVEDTLEIKLEDNLLFENIIVTSHPQMGTTGFNFFISQSQKNIEVYSVFIPKKLSKQFILSNLGKGKIDITIKVNQTMNNYSLDIADGKHIFFSKFKEADSLHIIQSDFSYRY